MLHGTWKWEKTKEGTGMFTLLVEVFSGGKYQTLGSDSWSLSNSEIRILVSLTSV